MNVKDNTELVWKSPHQFFVALIIAFAFIGVMYSSAIAELLRIWGVKEEYSYGYMIPFITLFFIWQKKDVLEKIDFTGSVPGVLLLAFGGVLFVFGELSTLYIIIQYSMLIVIMGLALSLVGWRAFKIIFIPLTILFFMVPLPQFFLTKISSELQLISSTIGVFVIRLFDISVYLEGNVIDLGSYKLQVVEACSGLRYLFPLMTLGFIAAYLYRVSVWKRITLFLSTIPITILMNSFRIGAIGVMVEYWGQSMADGFLHDFEGWVVFMACTFLLILEIWILNKIGSGSHSMSEVFGFDFPEETPKNAEVRYRVLPKTFIFSVAIIIGVTIFMLAMPEQKEIVPGRETFSDFPMKIDKWYGKEDRIEQIYLDELKLDDYVIADYKNDNSDGYINFYVAYYASQKKGQSAHSPRTCLPGGGWKMVGLSEYAVEGATINGNPLYVNRTLIRLGDSQQLVYYWFQQRGRVITNEYLVKWFIFWDSLTRHRSDGALVRLVTMVNPSEDIKDADARISEFIREVAPILEDHIPN